MSLYELLCATRPDEWRSMVGFSPDIEACHRSLFDPSLAEAKAEVVLNDWLRSRNHPCVFGRIAALRERHSFCVLTDYDLKRGDEHVTNAIQKHRSNWKHTGRNGKTSSFIIAVVSRTLALAKPDETLKRFALRLCELILGQSAVDEILHDELDLFTETGGLRWKAGMSLFATAGDKRWWHDHRFPGGIAFSLNSIGHVAAVRALEFRQVHFEERRLWNVHRWALRLAMHTINDASRRAFRCTWLIPRSDEPNCKASVGVGGVLGAFSSRHYEGKYHTDYTIPSEFFDTQSSDGRYSLSLSYLHDPTDPEYLDIAVGRSSANLSSLMPPCSDISPSTTQSDRDRASPNTAQRWSDPADQ